MPYKLKKKNITIATVSIGVVIIGIFSLVFTNMRDSIFGAPFEVTVARNGETLTSSFLPIIGKAKHARDILLNGRSITIDRNGNFTDAVILSPGYNTIEIALKDQFGKEKKYTYQFVYTPENAVAQTAPFTTNQQ